MPGVKIILHKKQFVYYFNFLRYFSLNLNSRWIRFEFSFYIKSHGIMWNELDKVCLVWILCIRTLYPKDDPLADGGWYAVGGDTQVHPHVQTTHSPYLQYLTVYHVHCNKHYSNTSLLQLPFSRLYKLSLK